MISDADLILGLVAICAVVILAVIGTELRDRERERRENWEDEQ